MIREKIAHSYSTGGVQSFMRLGSRKILYTAFFRANFQNSEERNLQGTKTQQLKVITIGKPDIRALSDNERTAFFETLLERLKELKEQNGNQGGK